MTIAPAAKQIVFDGSNHQRKILAQNTLLYVCGFSEDAKHNHSEKFAQTSSVGNLARTSCSGHRVYLKTSVLVVRHSSHITLSCAGRSVRHLPEGAPEDNLDSHAV